MPCLILITYVSFFPTNSQLSLFQINQKGFSPCPIHARTCERLGKFLENPLEAPQKKTRNGLLWLNLKYLKTKKSVK